MGTGDGGTEEQMFNRMSSVDSGGLPWIVFNPKILARFNRGGGVGKGEESVDQLVNNQIGLKQWHVYSCERSLPESAVLRLIARLQ